MKFVSIGIFAAGLTASHAAATMKAGALTKRPWDGKIHFEDLQEVDVEIPQPGKGQVQLKVAGSSVNPVDWKLIETPYALAWKYPHVFGRDASGVVSAVGEGVTRFQVGDAAWALSSNEGGYAEYLVLDEALTGHAPKSIPLDDAAVLPLVSLTGLGSYQLTGTPWASKDKVVLVLGGSGGCGQTGIQLAKGLGAAKVYTTCGTANVALCRQFGADVVIDYHKEDWHTLLASRSVDVVYDTVALNGTGDLAYDVLKDGGFFVTLLPQALASNTTAASRPQVTQKNFLLEPSTFAKFYTQLDILAGMVDAGQLKPHVDKTFLIAEVAQAFNYSIAGHTVGKVKVVPTHGAVRDIVV